MTVADSVQSDEAALLDFLRDRDVPCPLCAYNLRRLTSPRCPECGHELHLTVGVTDLRIGAWITGLIGIAAAAGFGTFAIIEVIRRGWPRGEPIAMHASVAYFVTSVPLLLALVMLRSRYRRLPQLMQWTFASVAVVLTVAAYVGLFAR